MVFARWCPRQVSPGREVGNVTFSRSGLAQWLINEARARYPTSIKFVFNAVRPPSMCHSSSSCWAGLNV